MTPHNLLDKADTYPLRGICMLVIFFHHAFNRYARLEYVCGGKELLINGVYSVFHWGFLATGIFFFLSGFGLYLSIQRNNPLTYDWLGTQLKKMIQPFLFLWVIYIIFFLIWDRDHLTSRLLFEFFTLCSPGRETWFFKVIVGTYLVTFFTFKYIRTSCWQIITLFILTTTYIVIMRRYSFGPWWYNSILNFPIGMIFAKYIDYVTKIPTWFILTLGSLIYLYSFKFIHCDIIESIAFTFMVIWIVRYINIRSPYLYYVGVHSLSFYFLETPIKQYITIPYIEYYWLYVPSTIVIVSILTLGYSKLIKLLHL